MTNIQSAFNDVVIPEWLRAEAWNDFIEVVIHDPGVVIPECFYRGSTENVKYLIDQNLLFEFVK